MPTGWAKSGTRAIALALTIYAATLGAETAGKAAAPPEVVTLGTMAGPIADPGRSQPATLLRWPGGMLLVDAGDGTAEQLAKAGVTLGAVDTIVLTHLHADHTGGLFAILAMRFQLNLPPLTIYGPPGTARTVAGLVAALQPLGDLGGGLPGRPRRDPAASVRVVEISGGTTTEIKGVAVRAATNAHFTVDGREPDPALSQSLSLRFEFPGKVVVVTGDTGPSEVVAELARDADVLVCEIIDPAAAMAALRVAYPLMPQPLLDAVGVHFVEQHLSAEAAGKLAAKAGVKRLVLTHIGIPRPGLPAARAEIARQYTGPVDFAEDLQVF